MIFTSSDKLHRKCAPLFLRPDQEFVWGQELKDDLKKIDDYFNRLPEHEKEKGLYTIAPNPPKDGNYLISQLWDRFLPSWRKRSESFTPDKKAHSLELVKELNKFIEGKPLKSNEIDFNIDTADAVAIHRKVLKKRGKWWQLPKDLPVK